MKRPKRSLAQNFLVDPNIQRKIVEALELRAGAVVVEIGPGQGALTQHLAGSVRRLVAVEKDDALAAALARRFAGSPDVEIVRADALEVLPAELGVDPPETQVLGNLPYNITSPLLFHLLSPVWRPLRLVLMIQREVADRILADPGGRDYGALSVGVRSVAAVERLFGVGRNAFRPVPGVDSTVLRLTPYRPPRLRPEEEENLRALTRAAFGQRRKQLQKILRSAAGYGLDHADVARLEEESGLSLERRPEELAPDELLDLSRRLRALGYPRDAG